jgi:APA family basic amino acid/polyamine antiporter
MQIKQLDRKLTFFPLTNIVIANMIGAGIFTTSGLLMRDLQNPGVMLLLWLIGGLIALCGALNYSELGAAIPEAGGEYAFLTRLYHPLVGFLSGWISFIVGFSAAIAASSIGFSEYLFSALPLSDGRPESVIWLKKIISVAVIALFTCIHLRGIKFSAGVQNFLTILKIILIIGLICLGFTAGEGQWQHLFQVKAPAFNFAYLKTVGLSLMWILFAYSGWNAATYIGSEIKNPGKNVPLSLLSGTGLVMLLYFLLNLFFVYAVNPEQMKGIISITSLAASHAFGRAMGSIISLIIAFALFSSLSAFVILGPRVYFAMGRDGVFFHSLSQIHPRFHVPSKAILLQGIISSCLVLTGSFDQILSYLGFSLGIFPILAVFGVFKLRREKRGMLKMPGYPLTTLIYLLTGTTILILAFLERPIESGTAIITVISGIPVYLIFKKRSGENKNQEND